MANISSNNHLKKETWSQLIPTNPTCLESRRIPSLPSSQKKKKKKKRKKEKKLRTKKHPHAISLMKRVEWREAVERRAQDSSSRSGSPRRIPLLRVPLRSQQPPSSSSRPALDECSASSPSSSSVFGSRK